ncbi:penicillin acylase family protein [Phenylobacterium sp.]|uniref:penicillin acylase family protein n=1 Tax=Phenylobacterium sp. TaxID=1871053 RepID=UPI0037CA4C5A
MRLGTWALSVAASLAFTTAATAREPSYRAELVRTAYGAPHVTAADYGGLGYGAGYAAAQDNFCDFAERTMTVSGERSRYLGAGERDANIVSDLYHQRLIRTGRLEAKLAGEVPGGFKPSADARALGRGFIAGINRYVRDTGAANLPDARCKGAAWIRAYTETDYWRAIVAGQQPTMMAGVATAAPPGVADIVAPHGPAERSPVPEGQGSNAYALGREVTKTGRGVLLGNPHYPWDGINRFTRMHLIIPGKLNIVGAGLQNSPTIGIGHNQWVAWTHTVSTARRFGLFELKLDPKDPTAYIHDGKSVPMEKTAVTIQVKTSAGLEPLTRTLYDTRFGPVVEAPTNPWTAERAFAVRDAPVDLRSVDQYLTMYQARNVRQLAAALSRFQAAGFNTTAVDAGGEAFYGDIGPLPFVTDAKAEACSVSDVARTAWKTTRVPVLDGSRSACEWDSDPRAATAGIYPASALPQIFRNDYASNSNDSYWLTNTKQPLAGFGRIFGEEATARSLRTRLSLKQIEDRVAGTDGLGAPKFDLAGVQAVLFGNRNLGAEMARDPLVALCRRAAAGPQPDLAEACDALAAWDLKVNLDSRGAHIFRLFADKGGLAFKVPFDPSDPVNTPNTLDVENPKVLAALLDSVKQLRTLKIPMNATLAQVQTEPRAGGERIPIHGGPGPEGIFNVITPVELKPELGWTKIRHGSSWIMAVEFTPKGPISQGVLSYSQSTNPTSPNAADQTRLYSQKGWDDLNFTPAAIRRAAVSTMVLKGK